MCGIFGFIGEGSWKTSLLLQALTIEDEVRGKHSSGIVIQIRGGECRFTKKALRGKEFVAQGHTAFLFKKRYGLALGHNRYATTGAITDRNAHPFGVKVREGWNWGIHNGVIRSPQNLVQKYGVKKADVDSETFWKCIAKLQNKGVNVIKAIESVTEFVSLNADFAFGYLETSERAVYLWRSIERPLSIFDARKLGLGRWFCSTKEIFANAWSSIAGALGSISKVSYFEAKPYRLYKVPDDGTYEVEIIKELKRRQRPKTEPRFCSSSSRFSVSRGIGSRLGDSCLDSYRQLSFMGDKLDDIVDPDVPDEDERIFSLSDTDLDNEIFDIEVELDGMDIFKGTPNYEATEEYLSKLYEERQRRRRIKKMKKNGVYNGI